MNGIQVAPASEADAQALAAIAKSQPTAPQWSVAQFLESLHPAGHLPLTRVVLTARERNSVVGFAVVSALRSVFPVEAELESLAVSPAHEGGGIGRALLSAALGWSSEQKAEFLRLEVRAGNARAIRLYTAAGFRVTGTRPGYYSSPSEDAMLMERTISPVGVPSLA